MMTKLQNLCFPAEEICPDSEMYFHEEEGRVRLDGKIWTARSESGEAVFAGEHVTVKDIQGVTLTVERQK